MATVPVAPPLCNYYTVNDSSPSSQVWDLAAGAFVALTDATFTSWLSQLAQSPLSQPYFPFYLQLFSAASSDAGATTTFRVDNTSIMTTGAKYNISGTGGLYDGNFAVTVVDGTHVKISVAFAGNTTGNLSGAAIVATAALLDNALRASGLSIIPTTQGFYSKSAVTLNNVTPNPFPLPNPLSIVTVVTWTGTAGAAPGIALPAMNMANSVPIGIPFYVTHDKASTATNIGVSYKDGTPIGGSASVIYPGSTIVLQLTDNSTANGTVQVIGVLAENNPLPVPLGGSENASLTANNGTLYVTSGGASSGVKFASVAASSLIGLRYLQDGTNAPVWGNPGLGEGDQNVSLLPTLSSGNHVLLVYTTATLTAARTWTLPDPTTIAPGATIIIADLAGGVSATNMLSVQRHGTEHINGGTASIVLNHAYAWCALVTDGTNWSSVDASDAFVGMSGDATATRAGVVTFASTITAGGPTGDASHVPQITYDAKGRLTAVTSVAVAISDSAITYGNESANRVFAGPSSGGAAAPAFRALVGADLPNPSATTLGGIESFAAQSHKWINAISTSGVPSATQPAMADLSDVVSAGAWTPTDQSGAGLTFSSVSVSYTKNGNMVFFYGRLTYPTTADTRNALISLPVAVPNALYAQNLNVALSTAAGICYVSPQHATSNCAVINSGGGSSLRNVDLSGGLLVFMGMYPAA
jgi:hypothetical protein